MFILSSNVLMCTTLNSFFYSPFLMMTVPTTATPSFRPTPAPTGKPSTAQPSSQPTSHPTSPSGNVYMQMSCLCHTYVIKILSGLYHNISCYLVQLVVTVIHLIPCTTYCLWFTVYRVTYHVIYVPHTVYYIPYTVYRAANQ